MTPRATLRLQFHKGFTFADARPLVPYMASLGVSHLYASPITAARSGSMHGYDVIDPTRVNPELGGEEELKRLVEALRKHGLGLIVDIVPNHMAASLENAWWADVLRLGRASRHARSFDIDWEAEDPQIRGKVFLPVLAKPLHETTPKDLEAIGLTSNGRGIAEQAYVPGWWRTANDRINWRRFFDINDLVCLRMDDAETFEKVHAMIARLYGEGTIDGVRVDHIDGLADPAEYCRKLRHRLDPSSPDKPYLVVEKILLKGETLPAEWGCDGTTGYDFMDQVSALQHDPAAEPVLAEAWAALSGRPASFDVEEQAARREIIAKSFAAPLEACIAAFDRLAKADPAASDLSRPALRRALVELLAHFPIYRSYGTSTERPARDRPYLQQAVDGAKQTARPGDGWVIDTLHRWMVEPTADSAAITRFQQLSAPVAAKSVEDTAFYRYGRLLSRNDVGFELDRFGSTAEDFHALMQKRQAAFPHAMLATATHDHKRGEDLRARLAVLSEQPREWATHLARWLDESRPLRTGDAPAAGDIAMLLQMIAGAWPLDLALDDAPGRADFAQRLAGRQEKALREAKLRTDWADPNEAYEGAARAFLLRLLADNAQPALLGEIFAFVQSIAAAGAVNGLAQLVLKLTAPGVPDLYQGTDYWDFSLVDPDNRRPVDFAARQKSLAAIDMADALAHWRDGRIKQAILARVLALRQREPELLADGGYEPVAVEGAMARHVVAFQRTRGDDSLLVVVPRLPGALLADRESLGLSAAAWKDTVLRRTDDRPLFDVLTSGERGPSGRDIALQQVLGRLPLALFSTRPV